MSAGGAPQLAGVSGEGRRIAVIAATWHDEIMAGLVAGAQRVLDSAGATSSLFRVPGSFELPLAAAAAARAGFDGVVALGVVIRGGTPHFEYVCQAATAGLARVPSDTGIPVGFGLLTCDDEAQARDRAGLVGSREDKGAEAAEAVLAMLGLLPTIKVPSVGPAAGFGVS